MLLDMSVYHLEQPGIEQHLGCHKLGSGENKRLRVI